LTGSVPRGRLAEGRPVRVPRRLPPRADHRGCFRPYPRGADARPHRLWLKGRPLRPAPPVAPDAAIPRRRRWGRDDDGREGNDGGSELGLGIRTNRTCHFTSRAWRRDRAPGRFLRQAVSPECPDV